MAQNHRKFVTVCECRWQTSIRFWVNVVSLISIGLACRFLQKQTLLTFRVASVTTYLWKTMAMCEIQELSKKDFWQRWWKFTVWVNLLQKHKMQKLSTCFSADSYTYGLSRDFHCMQFLRRWMQESGFVYGLSSAGYLNILGSITPGHIRWRRGKTVRKESRK